MAEHGFSALPAVDEEDPPVGIVAEAGVLRDRMPPDPPAPRRGHPGIVPGRRGDPGGGGRGRAGGHDEPVPPPGRAARLAMTADGTTVSTTGQDRAVVLDEAECHALVAAGRMGRLAHTRNALPAVHPVPYVLHDGEIVIPARPDSGFLPGTRGTVVAFGVDSHDESAQVGWSVTLVGPARQTDDPVEMERYDELARRRDARAAVQRSGDASVRVGTASAGTPR